jgi:HSP20 family protein
MISLLDAVDKIFDTAANSVSSNTYYISTGEIETTPNSITTTGNTFTDTYYYQNHYYPYYWIWPSVQIDIPKIDVPHYPVANGFIREDGSIYFRFAVTGYDKSELSIKAEDNTLVIEGKLKEKEDTSKWKELFHNLAIKDFIWKRRISNKYDLEKLDAKVEKGILEITIPLKEACKPIKKEFEIK